MRRTDEEGRVEFGDLLPGRADLHASLDPDSWPDYALGVLDLANGDGRLDVQLPEMRELTLGVRIDGEARLPAKFSVAAERLVRARTVEDPAKGELHLFVLEDGAGRTRSLVFTADDFPPQTVPVPPAQPDVPTRLDVELSTGGALVVRVVATPQSYPRLSSTATTRRRTRSATSPACPAGSAPRTAPTGATSSRRSRPASIASSTGAAGSRRTRSRCSAPAAGARSSST